MSSGLWLQVSERLVGSVQALLDGVSFHDRRLEELERRLDVLEKAQAEQRKCQCGTTGEGD